jgi:hypothetical protein
MIRKKACEKEPGTTCSSKRRQIALSKTVLVFEDKRRNEMFRSGVETKVQSQESSARPLHIRTQ